MFRNQYDSDIATWSPQGRIHQIEYAMEAVKQGSAVVGLKSEKLALIAAVKRSPSELASYQQKLFKLDSHLACGISGLTADCRVLTKYMRTEALNHRFVYGSPIDTADLVERVADKSQVHTIRYGRRPYGMGMLVVGASAKSVRLMQTCPSGNFFDYHAMAIGARSQSAKTYLERKFAEFAAADLDTLVRHALLALKETVSNKDDTGLTSANVSIGYVGVGQAYTELTVEQLEGFLDSLDSFEQQQGGDNNGNNDNNNNGNNGNNGNNNGNNNNADAAGAAAGDAMQQ